MTETNPAAAAAILTKGTEPAPAVVVGPTGGGDPLGGIVGVATGDTVLVAVEPTQVRKPWRATARTVFQAALAIATLVPFVAAGVYDTDNAPVIVTQVVVAAGTFSRVMALPQVNDFLARFLPFLSAAGK